MIPRCLPPLLALLLCALTVRAAEGVRVLVPVEAVACYPRLGLGVQFPAGTGLAWHESRAANSLWPHLHMPGSERRVEIVWVSNDPAPEEPLLPRATAAIAKRKSPILLLSEPRLIRVNGRDLVEARFRSPGPEDGCKSRWEAARYYVVSPLGKLAFLQFSGLDLPEHEELVRTITPLVP